MKNNAKIPRKTAADIGAPSAKEIPTPTIALPDHNNFNISIYTYTSIPLFRISNDVPPIAIRAAPTRRAKTRFADSKPNTSSTAPGTPIKGTANNKSTTKCMMNQ